jgi:short-subunit dehydrogenase
MPTTEPARRPVALVTGASSGIGAALARLLAQEGEDVVLVARSIDQLEALAAELRASGRAAYACRADLGEPGAGRALKAELDGLGLAVRHLVNNAGYGLAGDMADLPAEGQAGIVDLNCRALTEITALFLPDILAQRGGVLNVASVAGFTAGPGFAVYYASKAYVISLTRALAFETRAAGILVSALCPGPTQTRFNERAKFRGGRSAGLLRALDVMTVARLGLAGYRAGRLIVVPGLQYRILVTLIRVLPQAAVLPILARVQRARREGYNPSSP